jgi:hypothetical protein
MASREKHRPQQRVVKVYVFHLGDSEEGQCRAGVPEILVALKLKRLHHGYPSIAAYINHNEFVLGIDYCHQDSTQDSNFHC